MQERTNRLDREGSGRQETILLEAAERVRRYTGLSTRAKHSHPLILGVTKYDCWSGLLDKKRLESPWTPSSKPGLCSMQLDVVEQMSRRVRDLLCRIAPEIVSAAESFAEQVLYVPVTSTVRS